MKIIDDYVQAKPGQDHALRPVRRFVEAQGSTLSDLGIPWSEDYRAERDADDVSDSAVRRQLGAFVAALNWAADRKILSKADVPKIQLPPEGPAREVFLTEKEEAVFYPAALAHSPPEGTGPGEGRLTRLSRFVALALDTWARAASIETLTWDRVDFGSGVIDYRDPSRRATKKRRSVVPINSRLLPVLLRAHRERTNKWVLDEPGSVRTTWETWLSGHPDLDFARAKGITRHDLRRTGATLAARAGVDLWQIAGVLGDTLATVVKHYAHHQPDHLRGAVERRFLTAKEQDRNV